MYRYADDVDSDCLVLSILIYIGDEQFLSHSVFYFLYPLAHVFTKENGEERQVHDGRVWINRLLLTVPCCSGVGIIGVVRAPSCT